MNGLPEMHVDEMKGRFLTMLDEHGIELPQEPRKTTEQVVYASCVVAKNDDITKAVSKIALALWHMHKTWGLDGFLATCGMIELAEAIPSPDSPVGFTTKLDGRRAVFSFPKMLKSEDVMPAAAYLKEQGLCGREGEVGEVLP